MRWWSRCGSGGVFGDRAGLPGAWRHGVAVFCAAGRGPAATSFFFRESTIKESPSYVLATRSVMSPGSLKTTSSMVKFLSTRRMVDPTLRVIRCLLAMVKTKSFIYGSRRFFHGLCRNSGVFASGIHQGPRNSDRPVAVNMVLQFAADMKRAHGFIVGSPPDSRQVVRGSRGMITRDAGRCRHRGKSRLGGGACRFRFWPKCPKAWRIRRRVRAGGCARRSRSRR